MRTEIASELKSLRLYGMASAWDELLGQGETAALQSARWLLEHLLQAEGVPAVRRCHLVRSAAGSDQRLFALYLPGAELTLHAPVALAQVKEALGAPLKSEPSPYQCDSAYASEGTRLLTFRGAVFESDGKTAVLRQLLASGSADVQWQGLPGGWADLTLEKLQTATSVGKLQVDDQTLRLAPAPGASLETGWDFRFQDGHLNSITHWIGCCPPPARAGLRAWAQTDLALPCREC